MSDETRTPTSAQASAASMLLAMLPDVTETICVVGENWRYSFIPVIRADWLERELRKFAV